MVKKMNEKINRRVGALKEAVRDVEERNERRLLAENDKVDQAWRDGQISAEERMQYYDMQKSGSG